MYSIDEIEHSPFREIAKDCEVVRDIEVNLASDLPSFSGLGSSSSFTVGLIKGLNAHKGIYLNNLELAKKAIYIEREVLHEVVGLQDQIFAAYGGFNLIHFSSSNDFNVEKICIPEARFQELNNSLLLFFTGVTRRAQDLEKKKINNLSSINPNLVKMLNLVEKAHTALTSTVSLSRFGALLNETWIEKRQLDPSVSSEKIDALYKKGMDAGALGGKLLGAGGGGFMLFFVPPERHHQVRSALAGFNEVKFNINAPGSTVIHS